jgi:protein phosphatase
MFSDETVQLSPPQLIVGCGQSAGQQRDHNEDALFTLTTNLVSDTTYLRFGLFIIADGMGGHQHGELASGVAVRSMGNSIIRKLYIPFISPKAEPPEESIHEIIQDGIAEAHRSIARDASGGGTTLTMALIIGDQFILTHVGDSRAYTIFPDGSLRLLTRDHSLVRRLEELGQITAAEAAVHPQRNVLYRALGHGEPFEPEINTLPIPSGGYIMLCSDGLWGYVTEQKILQIIKENPHPELACQEMVEAANAAGGPDNISVILVYFPNSSS